MSGKLLQAKRAYRFPIRRDIQSNADSHFKQPATHAVCRAIPGQSPRGGQPLRADDYRPKPASSRNRPPSSSGQANHQSNGSALEFELILRNSSRPRQSQRTKLKHPRDGSRLGWALRIVATGATRRSKSGELPVARCVSTGDETEARSARLPNPTDVIFGEENLDCAVTPQ